jgi:hypothetical protein
MSVSTQARDAQTGLLKAEDKDEKPVNGISVPDLSIFQNANC